MSDSTFVDRRRLILGMRAAGLFLVGLGMAAPALLVGLIAQAMMSKQWNDPFAAYGTMDKVAQILSSKWFVLNWLSLAGLWLVSLLLGLYLVRRSSLSVVRLAARRAS
jgi:hypothetical protein